jgi:hypothetical protein
MDLRFVVVLGCVLGCGKGELGSFDDEIPNLAEACNDPNRPLIDLEFEIVFPSDPPGCDWGENGNLEKENGIITARAEQTQSLDVPDGVVLCDLSFSFNGIDPSSSPTIVYDDHFFLTFNDVVLAASYRNMVEAFPRDDGLPIYEWDRIAGYPVDWSTNDTFCLGEEEGLADCEIPPTEQYGPISLDFADEIIYQLSYRALDEGRFDYGFITVGDNDSDKDCTHEEFSFVVSAPALSL